MRTRIVLIVALSAGLVALAGCSGSGASQGARSSETTTSTSEDSTAPSTVETAETATDAGPKPKPKPRPSLRPATITIRVVGGTPRGGIARPTVKKNDRVVILVRSDTADEVHLHGYDISRVVAAGGSARLAFVATIRGRFEIELEDSGVQLAELTVR